MARPKKDIDARQVEEAIAQGNTVAGTAHIVGCSKRVLERRFDAVIEKGRERRNSSLQKKQFDMAMGGNATMAIWLGKQFLGQKDQQRIETTEDNTLTLNKRIVLAASSVGDKESGHGDGNGNGRDPAPGAGRLPG